MKPKRRPVCMPKLIGCMLITLGLGIFIAHVIPYQLLIFMLGFGITVFGIRCIMRH